MKVKSISKKLALVAAAAGCISLAVATVWGQVGASGPDQRLIDAMNKSELEYRVDDDNDVAVVLAWTDDRTHAVWANTDTETYEGIEIREVWTFVTEYASEDDIPKEVLLELMKSNSSLKFGKYGIIVNDDDDTVRVVFVITVSPNLDGESLAKVINFVGEVADEKEKVLEAAPGSDIF